MTDPAALTDEELAEIEHAAQFQNNGAQSIRLIAALRASRAEVARLEAHHREMHDPLA